MSTQATDNTEEPTTYIDSVLEEEYSDMPFQSWNNMRDALYEALNTEFAGETYPLWSKAGYPVCKEVKRLMKKGGVDKQQIIDDIVDLLCGEGNRYAHEFMSDCISTINILLKLGAVFPSDSLFDRWCDEDLETEMYAYSSRGELLDYYGPKGHITTPKSLKGLEPQDWEDIDDDEIDEIQEDEEATERMRLQHLIYCSEWLQELSKKGEEDNKSSNEASDKESDE